MASAHVAVFATGATRQEPPLSGTALLIQQVVQCSRSWDPKSGAETGRLEGNMDWVWALAVLPDGRLALGSTDNTIRLWDPSGAETARLEGHARVVTALAVLADGRLASGSDDKTIRLWDPGSGKEIVRLEVDAPVRSLAVLPSGRLIAGDHFGRLHWLEIVD